MAVATKRKTATKRAAPASKLPFAFPMETELQREVALRGARGIAMLDDVTPEWWEPINPATLVVSNREMCVFAQAHHEFAKGIIQVAEAAAANGRKVKTMPAGSYLHDWNSPQWGLERANVQAESKVIDTFYYGFDVDQELERLAAGSRRTAWGVIDKFWVAAVKHKKGYRLEPARSVADVIRLLKDEEFIVESANHSGGFTGDLRIYRDRLLRRIRGEAAFI